MTFTVVFDSAKAEDNPLARFSWTRASVTWADEVGPVVRDALKAKAPVSRPQAGSTSRPGRLRDSIRYERDTSLGAGGVTLLFTAHVPYAEYVIRGTGPHLIPASAARALRFNIGGTTYFRKSVHHPGTRANPFPQRTVVPMAAGLNERFRAAIEETMGP